MAIEIKMPALSPTMEEGTLAKWLVKEGDTGAGALYIILQGNVRVRKMMGGKENILATLSDGDLFGEVSLFDHGTRSADIVANSDGVLLRLGSKAFDVMVEERPEVAAPFMMAVAREMAGRIRVANERHKKDTIMMQTRR